MFRTLALSLVALTPALASAQSDCLPAVQRHYERQLAVAGADVGYYSTHSLTTLSPDYQVRRAVFLVHGLSGNAYGYFDTLLDSACMAKRAGLAPNVWQDTVLIAPHFRSTHDDNRPAGYHYWNGDHWSRGSESATGSGISSYAVVDTLVSRLTASVRGTPFSRLERRFPNLEMIVVAGHSAGGQLTHRYAGTNARDGSVAGVAMRYVVSAPSSFLYLDDHRPFTDFPSGVGDPYTYYSTPLVSAWIRNPGFSDAPLCPGDYDDWKYGLQDLNNYSSAVGESMIRLRLLTRRVTVLVGTADDDPDHENLDRRCPGLLQGPSRYDRAQRYLEYLDIRFPFHEHALVEVVGADHNQNTVFVWAPAGYPTGAATLFVD